MNADTAINHINFVTALLATHNGYVTINNTKTGQHRTFKIALVKKQSNAPDYLKGERVVSLLTGPNRENWQDWKRFAWIKDGKVRVWTSAGKKDGALYKMAGLLNDTAKGVNSGLEYLLEGTCSCCNKDLTHPTSVKLGMGPSKNCGGAAWKMLDKQLKAEAKMKKDAESVDHDGLKGVISEEHTFQDDLDYFNNALHKGLGVPASYLDKQQTFDAVADPVDNAAKLVELLDAFDAALDSKEGKLELCEHCAHCTTKDECDEGLLPWNGTWIPCHRLEESDSEAA